MNELRSLFALALVMSTFILEPLLSADELTINNSPQLHWHVEYGTAYAAAQDDQKLLLVYFEGEAESPARAAFEATLGEAQVRELCRDYILLRVPTSYEVTIGEETTPLIKHGAFAAMHGRAGLAVVDLKHSDRKFYGHTVSAIPFEKPAYYSPQYWSAKAVRTLLQLPAGTITQRTMVYAVRLHPEIPKSTRGRAEPYLFQEAAGHSAYQARIGVQGHQGFDVRFQRINARIGAGAASEVVAESWNGERMLNACFSCVHSWRGSPGHWSAVSSPQPAYGYDIKRSSAGTWYATGLFGG